MSHDGAAGVGPDPRRGTAEDDSSGGVEPTIAVAVCSAGRPALVGDAVRALLCLPGWHRGDEIVVALNGPATAAAARVLDHLASARDGTAAPALVVVRSPEAALCRARNAAAGAATADVVAYLDDDARPRPTWLPALRRAFSDPTVAAAGGPIHPAWPARQRQPSTGSSPPAPPWFGPRIAPLFSLLDLGPTPADGERRPAPSRAFGANLAVRRRVLDAAGRFDERIGRGTSVANGDDSDLLLRVHERGGHVGWVPDAVVDHLIGADRATVAWLLRRAHTQGLDDRHFRPGRPGPLEVVTQGWVTLAADLRADPRGWRAALVADLAGRARTLGRRRLRT